jgi:predicted Zn-dependent protease with MMP-like domain
VAFRGKVLPVQKDARVEEFASAIDQALDRDPKHALALARSADPQLAEHPIVRLMTGIATLAAEGPHAARADLETLRDEYPGVADIRHALGRVYEQLGRTKPAAAEYVHTWELDTRDDDAAGFRLDEISDALISTAERVVQSLPHEFRSRLEGVPIVVETRPDRYLVEQGFDPRSVGLFEGPEHRDSIWDSPPMLPRIVLYAANLMASVDAADASELERQVEITVLHEIGHYFGLEEERLHELGLG